MIVFDYTDYRLIIIMINYLLKNGPKRTQMDPKY